MADLSIRKNVELKGLNSLRLASLAEYYCETVNDEQLQEAMAFGRSQGKAICILGGGSNVLLTPRIPGLVIHPVHSGITLLEDGDRPKVSIAAGEDWHQLVLHCLEKGWYGLENLALIPGNAGAAPIQNIGAYGVELADFFVSLEAIHIETGERVSMDKQACRFGYRDSVFKQTLAGKMAITSITLQLHKSPDLQLDYPVLKQAADEENQAVLSPQWVAGKVMEIRRGKLPDPATLPNAGSFFKNPVIVKAQAQALREKYPGLVSYPVDADHAKVAAGWLIEAAGWKGKRQGSVGMHDLQALVLINYASARLDEVLALAGQVSDSVQALFGIRLEREPILLGSL